MYKILIQKRNISKLTDVFEIRISDRDLAFNVWFSCRINIGRYFFHTKGFNYLRNICYDAFMYAIEKDYDKFLQIYNSMGYRVVLSKI